MSVVVGFGTGLSLIAAIGAQNAFVLRQGLRREHVPAVVVFCVLADLVLVTAAVAGVGLALSGVPGLAEVVRWGGVVYLVAYGLLAARRAVRPGTLTADARGGARRLAPVLGSAAALTFLNPHMLLDLLVLGSLAAAHGDDGRWAFAAGVMAASLTWFAGLGFGAARLAGLFARPVAWRVLDGVVATVMLGLAAGLALT
ncbi:amino acid transporter [Pseudonocardia sp. EC080610-09]|uniref:LysE/ArgO family amino acid transporter n=1 Tax=unclassified Pseudonocardia TaxID=2619320 RepID=UPI0006CAFBAA|nr:MULTISPECIES: LysE family transporter [unclassified Pseudonocardia]ALE73166.1 amino acid transporter [Pseudonocardia sp. EC080625-04]ALL76493.1 amino acid transporter [Pseudonocardia sp. EC080610-09]ALL83518.1 amino acid transporter [Pseudonocardia sp. EC080619-01]